MKQIKLTQGKVALVDNKDFKFLNQWKWHAIKIDSIYYACRKNSIGESPQRIFMHRVLLKAKADQLIDHKDTDGLNNQKENLRFCTRSENARNRKSMKKSTSKYLGVSWDKEKSRWRGNITKNGKNIKLGTFKIEKEAAVIYNIAARKYYGEFARPNKL